jgi:Luciferase-like monooxygenase
MAGEPHCAVGVPNVGPFGDPLLLVELAVAAEEHGWDGFFVWDHLLYHDQRWDVADPVAVIAAVAARTARIRIGVLVNVLARRRIGEVARESVTVDLPSGADHSKTKAHHSGFRTAGTGGRPPRCTYTPVSPTTKFHGCQFRDDAARRPASQMRSRSLRAIGWSVY